MDECYKAVLLSRAGARVDWKAAAKLVEEDGNMDECYKAVLLRHLKGRDDPLKENTNKCDVIGEKRKTDALNKTERLVRDAKCARCSAPLNKRDSKPVSSEVEILDSDVIVRKGNPGPFIPAVQHWSLNEDPSTPNEFRREVLEVLRRPFDKQEYKKFLEEVRDKSYIKHYPDLQTKLTEFRYKKDKRLILLRGFFFWLENVTREGSFKPWLDNECLTMELPSR